MTKKMTKRDWYESFLAMDEVKANEGAVKFIEHELELLAKKNSADRKPTAVQKRNEEIKALILDTMEENNVYTITQILKLVQPFVEDVELTNQRVSALVTAMVKDEKIKRFEDKRKAYFEKLV